MNKNVKAYCVKIGALLIVLGLWAAWGIGAYLSISRPIYNEYYNLTEKDTSVWTISAESQSISQTFVSRYDILRGVAIRISTMENIGNSLWQASLKEDGNNILYEWNFSKSDIRDGKYHKLIFDNNIKIEKNKEYQIVIRPTKITNDDGLGFYVSEEMGTNQITLDMRVIGGERNWFGIIFSIVAAFYLVFMLLYAYYLQKRKIPWHENKALCMMLFIATYFLMLSAFSSSANWGYIDETDNMFGGSVIARGGVLYQDYITQHTPIAYYLCAVYAWLGTQSIQQFRLLFYLTEAFIWGILYFRHREYVGKIRMFALPFFLKAILFILAGSEVTQLFGDNLQGIAIAALTLEFASYLRDFEIDWTRSWIVGISIVCCIGVAFISAYAVAVIGVSVLISEISACAQKKLLFQDLVVRLSRLMVACLAPVVIMAAYFGITGAMQQLYELAYCFNTEVYAKYLNGFGSNKLLPIVLGFQGALGQFVSAVRDILTLQISLQVVLCILIESGVLWAAGKCLLKKRILESVTLICFFCMNAVRTTTGVHSISYWTAGICIIGIYLGNSCVYGKNGKVRAVQAVAFSLLVAASFPFLLSWKNFIFAEDMPDISSSASKVIALTEKGDRILFDASEVEPLYLLYKERYPAGSLPYFLPWYMEWYENDTVNVVEQDKPEIIVFDPEKEVWGYRYFHDDLTNTINSNYVKFKDNETIYVLKERK